MLRHLPSQEEMTQTTKPVLESICLRNFESQEEMAQSQQSMQRPTLMPGPSVRILLKTQLMDLL